MKKISQIFKEISDKQLKEDLNANAGLFLLKYSGVNSSDLSKLRRDLKNAKARMFVVKNNFINVALKAINKSKEISDFVAGPTALIFVEDDPVGPSKVLTDFSKAHESVQLKGGYIRDRIVLPQEFKMLASIPPRQVLYQQVAVALNGPISKLAINLNQIVVKLALVVKALSEKKEEKK